jgi:hypothetical protein
MLSNAITPPARSTAASVRSTGRSPPYPHRRSRSRTIRLRPAPRVGASVLIGGPMRRSIRSPTPALSQIGLPMDVYSSLTSHPMTVPPLAHRVGHPSVHTPVNTPTSIARVAPIDCIRKESNWHCTPWLAMRPWGCSRLIAASSATPPAGAGSWPGHTRRLLPEWDRVLPLMAKA